MWYDTVQFEFDTQYWANRGYMVLMVNYRGSISYGEAFCQSIQGDWGPREHDDVMSGVDYLISQGWTTEAQLYCTGFSQGGIMTNWAVGHTDRFRAAVSEHGMWDYVAAYGTDDCHLWWQDDLGVPWQNPDLYYKIAPVSGLKNIRTPLLITAGEHDWRCPLNQAEELYVALRKRGVPTELVIYPGEHHAITRPSRAIDRLQRIDDWLARYGGLPVDKDAKE
jgi:dipeptidyl aminopeptidase/acylaminoacyl peptidase